LFSGWVAFALADDTGIRIADAMEIDSHTDYLETVRRVATRLTERAERDLQEMQQIDSAVLA
jgi:hypothetical protein